jgi:hypothetical protein
VAFGRPQARLLWSPPEIYYVAPGEERREMNEIEPKMRTMREKERPREIKRDGGITRRH